MTVVNLACPSCDRYITFLPIGRYPIPVIEPRKAYDSAANR